MLVIMALFIASGLPQAASPQPETKWSIENTSLSPDTNVSNKLPDGSAPNKVAVEIVNSERGTRFSISSETRLTEVEDSFIWRDRLAVIGRAGRASAVLVFDLVQRRLADWFYCIEPKRVSANWIAYVEWYPRLFGAAPREVVLIYDLSKDPAFNRLASAMAGQIPAPLLAAPVQVGMPIYPESNVQQRSYRNVAEYSAENETVLAYLSFHMLPGERLVFAAAQGEDFPTSHNFIVVVDL